MNIKDNLQKIDKDHFQLLIDIGDVAKKNNLKAYLVGGMVRDLLLGCDNLDIDITVENDSLKLADAIVKAFPNSKLSAKHDRFHTAKIIFDMNGQLIPVDLASTREEIYKHPAALPDVRVSELKKDLIRRDFTINALAVSLLPNDFGEVVDLFNGLDDLKNKKIRILHDKSFIDDPTRMIRAVRFAEKLDFEIEEKTNKLLKETIESKQFDNLIEEIRGDRVKIEIRYLFNLPNVEKAVKAFFESGICKMISIRLEPCRGIACYAPTNVNVRQWLITLALILNDLDTEHQKKIMTNLQLTNDEIAIIEKGLSICKKFHQLIQDKIKLDSLVTYKTLSGLDIESVFIIKSLFSASGKVVAFDNAKVLPFIDEYLEKTSKIKLEITGEDLIKIGIPEGKEIGKTLQKVLEKKIQNPSMKKEDEIREARQE